MVPTSSGFLQRLPLELIEFSHADEFPATVERIFPDSDSTLFSKPRHDTTPYAELRGDFAD